MYDLEDFEPINFGRASKAPELSGHFSDLLRSLPRLQELPESNGSFLPEAIAESNRIRDKYTCTFNSLHFQDIPSEFSITDLVVTRDLMLFAGILPSAWIHFYSVKETYQRLGLCILATILNPSLPQITLYLTHPRSEVKALIIKPIFDFGIDDKYLKRPVSFQYSPSESKDYPAGAGDTLPCLGIYSTFLGPHTASTNISDYDLLIGFGRDAACIDLSQNLLDFGDEGYKSTELDFKHDNQRDRYSVGFRFYLKGAFMWPDDLDL